MLFIVLLSVVTTLCYLFNTFLIIYSKIPNFGPPNFRMWMRKIWAIYWYQNLKNFEVSWGVKKVIRSRTFLIAFSVYVSWFLEHWHCHWKFITIHIMSNFRIYIRDHTWKFELIYIAKLISLLNAAILSEHFDTWMVKIHQGVTKIWYFDDLRVLNYFGSIVYGKFGRNVGQLDLFISSITCKQRSKQTERAPFQQPYDTHTCKWAYSYMKDVRN